ncbi:MAG: alpha/beta hydrolase [Alphaproteobacteria bacterium]|nr:alpha/beta hydrolase [Alphaproteobacteria bacterium]MCB9795998.1 alpha/beta hydrolase [Alphaproteobacteria bacterium]
MPRHHVPETGWVPIQANGLTHAAFIDSEGPLVILQHGFPDTPHTWDELVPHLVEAGYRVVRPFGRGIAPSEAPAGDAYRAEDISGDLVALIEALGEERATLIGHDWGASAVWGAAHLAPERIERLIAVAIPHPAVLKASLAKVWGARHFLSLRLPGAARRFARDDFATLRVLYERWSPGFDWPEAEFEPAKNAYSAPGSLDAALGYYRCLGLWPFRGRVKVDALVLGGQTDGVATEADFMASPRRVHGTCEVKMLPGGHFLHREHPQPFIEAVLDFLR